MLCSLWRDVVCFHCYFPLCTTHFRYGGVGMDCQFEYSLAYGRDYKGDVCGSSTTHPGAKLYQCDQGTCTQVYYPKVNEDVAASIAFVALSGSAHVQNFSFSLFGVCLSECPKAMDVVCTYDYTVRMLCFVQSRIQRAFPRMPKPSSAQTLRIGARIRTSAPTAGSFPSTQQV